MKVEAHVDKFKRFDSLRSRLDPQADFELWYWVTLNAGTAIINAALHAAGVTREDSSFANSNSECLLGRRARRYTALGARLRRRHNSCRDAQDR